MSLVVRSPWEKDLLNDAIKLLGITDEPTRDKERADIQNIVDEFALIFGDAADLPKISKARGHLKDWAREAKRLAESFRTDINSLKAGSATNDPAGNQARSKKDQQELNDLESEILAAASRLDQIATTLRDRANRWPKNTGQLSLYQMVHGNPKEPFALDCVRVFAAHRPNDVKAGRTRPGGLYEFIELIYHLASGSEPKGDELLRPLRWAIDEYKKSLPHPQ